MKGFFSIVGMILSVLARFLFLTTAITLAGALVGALLFIVVGTLFGMDLTPAQLIRNGLFDGGFFALIWAPGISFVTLIIQAHKRRRGAGYAIDSKD